MPEGVPEAAPAEQAAARLRGIVRTLNRRARAEATEEGPTRSQQGVLAWLEESGELTAHRLAALERVRPQSMGQTVDALVRQGWVVRTPHPGDRRQVLLAITRAGREALGQGRRGRQAWLAGAMQRLLSDEERLAVLGALELLERVVDEPEERDQGDQLERTEPAGGAARR
jgi:DNA-binding MarR family transcriptional regulator